MPLRRAFHRKRRPATARRARHGRKRFHKRRTAHVKDIKGLFPKTCHTKCVLATDYMGNNTATVLQLSMPLNAMYRPLLLMGLQGGVGTIQDCAPYFYLDTGSLGTGLVGSRNTGAAYNQYKVLGCKIKYEIINNSANALKFRGYLNDPTTNTGAFAPTFSAGNNFAENQRFHADLLIPANLSQTKPTVFQKYFSAKSMFQMTHAQIAADSGESPTDSICVRPTGVGSANYALENPPALSWWLCKVSGLNGSALAVNDVFVRIRVQWYLELFGKNLVFEGYTPSKDEEKKDPPPEEKKEDDDPDEDPDDSLDGLPPELIAKFAAALTGRAAKKTGPSSASAPSK